MDPIRITAADTALHPAFFAFVATIFRGLPAEGWQRWADRGGWTDDYEVLALRDAGALVATVGRSRMNLRIDGQPITAIQLGAVATHPAHRHAGLARRLIAAATPDDTPAFLFANRNVLDFYPRLGFRRLPQQRAIAPLPITPATPARRLDLASPTDRARLADLCARAAPTGGRLAAQAYGPIALWHLTCRALTAFHLPTADAIIVASQYADRLTLHDVFTPTPFDLTPHLPHLATAPVTTVDCAFDPSLWLPAAIPLPYDDSDDALFLRGADGFTGPAMFPALAQT